MLTDVWVLEWREEETEWSDHGSSHKTPEREILGLEYTVSPSATHTFPGDVRLVTYQIASLVSIASSNTLLAPSSSK
jgi:hypothetical protein